MKRSIKIKISIKTDMKVSINMYYSSLFLYSI